MLNKHKNIQKIVPNDSYDTFHELLAKSLCLDLISCMAYRARGSLLRKSQKHLKKWQECFYSLDLFRFPDQLTLQAHSIKQLIYEELIS